MIFTYDTTDYDQARRSGRDGYGGWSQGGVALHVMKSEVVCTVRLSIGGKAGIGGRGKERIPGL